MDFKVLAVGDVVGEPGLDRIRRSLRYLKRQTGADFVNQQEGVVRAKIHTAATDEVDDCHRTGLGIKNSIATTGGLGGIVCRPQDLGTVVQIGNDFPAVEAVITQGDDICTGIQNILCLLGCNAYYAGIFTVYHNKICPGFQF